jgi:hypothetical protein
MAWSMEHGSANFRRIAFTLQWALGRRKARGANNQNGQGAQGRHAARQGSLEPVPRLEGGFCLWSLATAWGVFSFRPSFPFQRRRFSRMRLSSDLALTDSLQLGRPCTTLLSSLLLLFHLLFSQLVKTRDPPTMRASAQLSVSGYFSGLPDTGFALS